MFSTLIKFQTEQKIIMTLWLYIKWIIIDQKNDLMIETILSWCQNILYKNNVLLLFLLFVKIDNSLLKVTPIF